VPTAARNTLNDVARDVQQREEQEVSRVFDRPNRQVSKPFFVKRATKTKLVAEVKTKDVLPFLDRVLSPHMPGRPNTRDHTAFEWRLQNAGLLKRNQYIIPSRTQRKNAYGNVTRGTYSKMLADLRVYREAGFNGNTKRNNAGFAWLTVKEKYSRGKGVTGIWYISRLRNRRPGALAMIVVDKPPTYAKRFRFHDVGVSHARKVLDKHARAAIQHAIRRRG
jgi:hypothetical protein